MLNLNDDRCLGVSRPQVFGDSQPKALSSAIAVASLAGWLCAVNLRAGHARIACQVNPERGGQQQEPPPPRLSRDGRNPLPSGREDVKRGTIMPSHPVSRTRLIFSAVPSGTRTSVKLRLAIAWSALCASCTDKRPCSRSMKTQSKPNRARASATSGEAKVKSVPMIG